jgi:hypothetical protein
VESLLARADAGMEHGREAHAQPTLPILASLGRLQYDQSALDDPGTRFEMCHWTVGGSMGKKLHF